MLPPSVRPASDSSPAVDDIPASAILAELEDLCARDEFARSHRQTDLLRYVVRATLDGQDVELKEYTVGVSALGKRPDFDPKIDSSVRSEASRLRTKLDAVYAAEPDRHTVRIRLPKGHYRPVFEAVAVAMAVAVPVAVALPPPAVVPEASAGAGARAVTSRRWFWYPSALAVAGVLLGAAKWPWHEAAPALLAPEVRRFDRFNTERHFPKISPDGRLMVFSQMDGARPFLYLLREGSTPVALGEQGEHAAWSPDGRQLAFRSERGGSGLFVMDVATKEVRQVAAEGFHPSWSPDNSRIVYSTERFVRPEARPSTRSALGIVDLARDTVQRLALPPAMRDAIEPAWSPNGQWIAFWSVDAGGRRDVFVMPAEGGTPVRITEPDALDWDPVWAPDGTLYWSSNRSGTTNVWRVAIGANGGPVGRPEPVPLPTAYAGFSSFDHAGRLFYASLQPLSSIFSAAIAPGGLAMSEPVRVTPETMRVRHPSRSPDGAWVAAYALDPQEDLVVFRRDGSDLRRLMHDAARDRGPAWSPDGRRIAFVSNRGGDYQLWSVQPDGQALTPITQNPNGAFAPVWSPDGQQIAWFERGRRVNVTHMVSSRQSALPAPPGQAFVPTAWWQGGRALLGTLASDDGDVDNPLVSYALDSGTLRPFAAQGRGAHWLVEGRTLLFLRANAFYTREVATGAETLLRTLPGSVSGRFDYAAADRTLFFEAQESRVELWTARVR